MSHNNFFIAFALSIALSTTICFSAQESPKNYSLVYKAINALPNSVINIMHDSATILMSAALWGTAGLGLFGLLFYFKNKPVQHTPETKGQIDVLASMYTAEVEKNNRTLEEQRRQLEEERKKEKKQQEEKEYKKQRAEYTKAMEQWRQEKDRTKSQ